ncbi:MAG: hypothetical protein NT171_03450 [Planctomycetota bacterium]|nr:hypothetical protein [Planctomycetota bacterium]
MDDSILKPPREHQSAPAHRLNERQLINFDPRGGSEGERVDYSEQVSCLRRLEVIKTDERAVWRTAGEIFQLHGRLNELMLRLKGSQQQDYP